AGVAQIASAKKRVRHILADSPDEACVILLCASAKIYDAAFEVLNISAAGADLDAAHKQRH
ncbi:hypothetical protein ACI3PL_29830, partial [Lacticaseibacillus paracasei]